MNPLTSDQVSKFQSAFPSTELDVDMSRRTYLKIGGPARLFLSLDNNDDLISAIREANALKIPFAILGGGSNILVSDTGYEGLILQSTDREIIVDEERITASAGAITALVARKSVEAGLGGFEWGIGVPGTIGGAVYGNAGCFGGEVKDVVESVDVYSPARQEIMTLTNEDCCFAYRDSLFKTEQHLILRAIFKLGEGDHEASRLKMDEIFSTRKKTQPQGAFSAGCLFKNYETTPNSSLSRRGKNNSSPLEGEVRRGLFNIPDQFLKSKVIPAGWLIEQCGLKGKRVGDAEVSDVHANFIINRGKATANDIHGLFQMIQKSVQEKTGILLQNEVQFLGF